MTHTRRNITYYSTISNGYPKQRMNSGTVEKTGKRQRIEKKQKEGQALRDMMYIPLAESLQKETEPWTS